MSKECHADNPRSYREIAENLNDTLLSLRAKMLRRRAFAEVDSWVIEIEDAIYPADFAKNVEHAGLKR